MLLTDVIGYDAETNTGIIGAEFARELTYLDTLGKSKIHLWINSPGGSMMDSDVIVGAILKCKTPVETCVVGTAASSAFPIFLAGSTRVMMDYSKVMMHPASGGDTKTREVFEAQTAKLMAGRMGMTEDCIKRMMNETTWLTAEQCGPKGYGICQVESTAVSAPNNAASFLDFKQIVNKLVDEQKPKIKTMKEVTNRLKLNEAANEQQVVAAIDALENKLTATEKEKSELAEGRKADAAKIAELTNKLTEIENKAKADAEVKAKEAEIALKNKAEADVKQAVVDGKLENKKEVTDNMIAAYIAAPEATRNLIASLPVNRKSPGKIIDASNAQIGEGLGYNIAVEMAKIANRSKQN